YFQKLRKEYETVDFDYFQSNVEGELVNEIQNAGEKMDAIVLNAGAYTHTSIAIGDAIAAIRIPVVEVHISNVEAREEFRKYSHISSKCAGTISGFGLKSYLLAVESFVKNI